ncbi:hypothetical protein [Devosia sp. Naph2]|uniref:hypothetical protein n=1 Tax=Devosia polycyclovorans TaxID=3345148 RepID=UPI0035D0E5E7
MVSGFYPAGCFGQAFAGFPENTHKGALAKPDCVPYLAIAPPHWRATPAFNTRKERNDDDDIEDLHDPCHVFDRSNLHAKSQTLARVLSRKTNVI